MTFVTTNEAASELRVKQATILGMIGRGVLEAVDVSINPGSRRPSWRIPREALDELLASRVKRQPVAKPRRARKSAPAKFYA
jgi:excisionase family DNA binding protein